MHETPAPAVGFWGWRCWWYLGSMHDTGGRPPHRQGEHDKHRMSNSVRVETSSGAPLITFPHKTMGNTNDLPLTMGPTNASISLGIVKVDRLFKIIFSSEPTFYKLFIYVPYNLNYSSRSCDCWPSFMTYNPSIHGFEKYISVHRYSLQYPRYLLTHCKSREAFRDT